MKYGVLLISTGMPDDHSAEAVRRYTETTFASPLYQEGLGMVSGQLFKKVTVPAKAKEWTRYFEGPGKSSIEAYRTAADSLSHKLEKELASTSSKSVVVEAGMLCGSPCIADAVARLKTAGCDVVLLLPLCPFYFKPFVDQALLAGRNAVESLEGNNWRPKIREVKSFCKAPGYVKALAERIRDGWEPRNVSRLLILMPSQPRATSTADSTYEDQVAELKTQLQKQVKISPEQVHVAYLCDQDNVKWIGPFAEKTLLGWVGGAVRDIRAVSPAFCLPDTLGAYDAALRLGDYFKKNVMGKPPTYHFVSSFDDSDEFVKVLGGVVKKRL